VSYQLAIAGGLTVVALCAHSSHGCIRMFNIDILDLFVRVSAGTPVFIEANANPFVALDSLERASPASASG
jgi:L,D-transpeptidase catalytic domain